MRGFFTNLSAFRLLILFFLAMAFGFFMYARYQGTESVIQDGDRYRRVYNSLFEGADVFTKRVTAQESLGMALALQFELMAGGWDAEEVGKTLNRALETSPGFIQGVGIFLPGSGNAPRMYSFVTRQPQTSGDVIAKQMIASGLSAPEPPPAVSAKEKRAVWSLIANPPAALGSRFSSLLTLRGKDSGHGEILVKADLSWLSALLRNMHEAGGETAVCITPEGDAVWLENDRLRYNLDFPPGERLSDDGMIEKAMQAADSGMDADRPDFIRAEILGTGWVLVVSNSTLKDSRPASLTVAALFFSIAVSALAGELAITRMRLNRRRRPSSGTVMRLAGSSPPKEEEEAARMRHWLRQANKYLFRYRMSDPEQERIDSELRVARHIQFSLVPVGFPAYSEWREFDLFSVLYPAKEVGGDYYDFFMPDSNRLVLTVGDVSGKGVPAALYMAVCRTAFRTLAHQASQPGELLTNLNDMLVRDSHSGLYVTIACFFVDLPTGKCQYSLAGHPAPLLFSQALERVDFVDSPRETFIGMKAGIHFPTGSWQLDPGDTLLFYTDGVSEARNEAGDDLDYEGLRKIYSDAVERGGSCQNLIENLENSIRVFVGDRDQEDDITLMAFRYWGPGGQKMRKRKEKSAAKG